MSANLVKYNNYIEAVKKEGTKVAAEWGIFNRNVGVGLFDELNKYRDYEYLLSNIELLEEKRLLDFGCGPGRNMRNCTQQVAKIDGVDLIEQYFGHANKYLTFCGYDRSSYDYYLTNGYDLSNISDEVYDMIVSSNTLQFICIYDIRFNYFKEFFRVLKSGGLISLQMGYGVPSPNTVSYSNNTWNKGDPLYSVAVENVSEIQNDLENIGFINFTYQIVNPPLGDSNPSWIFFRAEKP